MTGTATQLETKREVLISTVKAITLSNGHIVMFYNAHLVNPKIIDFVLELLEVNEDLQHGCRNIVFRNDGEPYEPGGEKGLVSALGCYEPNALSVIIGLEGILENASNNISSGMHGESLVGAVYHLIFRSLIHELIHGDDYTSSKIKTAWHMDHGEDKVVELADLMLIETAKTNRHMELPKDVFEGSNWLDEKICGILNSIREKVAEHGAEEWEANQLYMLDNGLVFRSHEEEIKTMREYYRSLDTEDGQTDAAWTLEVVDEPEPVVEEPTVVETTEPVVVAAAEPVSEPTVLVVGDASTKEQLLQEAIANNDQAAIINLIKMAFGMTPAVDASLPVGEVEPTDGAIPADMVEEVVSEPVVADPGAALLAAMNKNIVQTKPMSAAEQTVRAIVEQLFSEMFNKCEFVQGHWMKPLAILDPVAITIPGAASVLHSFDYTNGASQDVKNELFGGMIKGQVDRRPGKHMKPSYTLHFVVNGISVSRKLQPFFVIDEQGRLMGPAAGQDRKLWESTSPKAAAIAGKQVAMLVDTKTGKLVYRLDRLSDGSVKWEKWGDKQNS